MGSIEGNFGKQVLGDLQSVVPHQTEVAIFPEKCRPSQKPQFGRRQIPHLSEYTSPHPQEPCLSLPASLHMQRRQKQRPSLWVKTVAGSISDWTGCGAMCSTVPGTRLMIPVTLELIETPSFKQIPLDCLQGSLPSLGQGNILGHF